MPRWRSPAAANRPLGPSNDDAKLLKVAQFRRGCQFVGLAFAGLERASRVGARLAVDRQCNGILSKTRGSSHQRLRCRLQGRTVGSEELHFKGSHPTAALLGPDRLHRGSRTRQVGDREAHERRETEVARSYQRAHCCRPLRSEEGTDERRGNSSCLFRCLIRLHEQAINDGLTAGVLDGFRTLRRPGQKRVDMLDDIVRGHEAPGLAREQCPGFRVAYAEERRRFPEAVATREAPALKPLVLRRVPTRTVVPVRDVKLPLGDVRENSLQLFEPLHVHGDLPGALFSAGTKAYAVRRKPQPAGGVSAIAHLAAASPELLAILAAT